MKRKYFLLISAITCFTICNAQVEITPDSSKTDSVSKPNMQSNLPVQAQPETPKAKKDTRPMSERFDFDLSASFWVNTQSTFFEISPVVSYKFPKIISIGAGPTYLYNHNKSSDVNLNGFGGKVFTRAQLTKWFYAYTEYQGINNQYITGYDASSKEVTKGTQYVDSWFLSLGINIGSGRRHGINIQALYDVLYDEDTSPYYAAWTYRIGYGF